MVAYPAGDLLKPEITEAEIARRASEPGPLRLLFLGNLIARKGLHTLLGALQQLPAETCTLSVVGSQQVDPAYVRTIRRQIERGGLSGRVQLLGSLPGERTGRLPALPSPAGGAFHLRGLWHRLPGGDGLWPAGHRHHRRGGG